MGSHSRRRRFPFFGGAKSPAPRVSGDAYGVRQSTRTEMGLEGDYTRELPLQAGRVVAGFASRPTEQAARDDSSEYGYSDHHYADQPPTGDRSYEPPRDAFNVEGATGPEDGQAEATAAAPRHYGEPAPDAAAYNDTQISQPRYYGEPAPASDEPLPPQSPYTGFVDPDDTQVIRFPGPDDLRQW